VATSQQEKKCFLRNKYFVTNTSSEGSSTSTSTSTLYASTSSNYISTREKYLSTAQVPVLPVPSTTSLVILIYSGVARILLPGGTGARVPKFVVTELSRSESQLALGLQKRIWLTLLQQPATVTIISALICVIGLQVLTKIDLYLL